MSINRVESVVQDLVAAVAGVIEKRHVEFDEYRAALGYLIEVAEAGEMPLLADVFLAVPVDDTNNRQRLGSPSNVEGPYYKAGAPTLESPYRLARPDEPGERLVVRGLVRSLDGPPLADALLDFWHADGQGRYSMFDPALRHYNLRGQLMTDAEGRYEVQTIVPSPYQIPHAGPTGKLLRAMGRHTWRPAHLHLKVSAEGHRPLTTQAYFEGGEWVDSDVVRAVKDSLLHKLERDGDGYRLIWDIELEPAV